MSESKRLFALVPIALLAFVTTSLAVQPEAVCKVSSGNGKGTGVIFEISNNTAFGLTNNHVIEGQQAVECEFWAEGHKSSPIAGQVVLASPTVDAAVFAIPIANFVNPTSGTGEPPRVIPMAPRDYVVKPGDTIASAGCPKAAWLTAWRGHALGYSQNQLAFSPPPIEGRSGSPLTDANGTKIIGLIRARTGGEGDEVVGLAVTIQDLYRALCREVNYKTSSYKLLPGQPVQCPPGGGCQRRGFGRQQQQQPQPPANNLWPTLPQTAGPAPAPVDLSETNGKLDKIAELIGSQQIPPATEIPPMPIPPSVTKADVDGAVDGLRKELPKTIADTVQPMLVPVVEQVKQQGEAIAPLVRVRDKLEADADKGGLQGKLAQKVIDWIDGKPAEGADPVLHSQAARTIGVVLGLLFIVFVGYRIHNGTSLLGKLVDMVQAKVGAAVVTANPAAAPAVVATNTAIDAVQALVDERVALALAKTGVKKVAEAQAVPEAPATK